MKRSAVDSYPNFSDARVKDAQFPRFFGLSFALYRRGDLEVLRGGALLKLKHFYIGYTFRGKSGKRDFLFTTRLHMRDQKREYFRASRPGIETEVSPCSFVTMESLPERRVARCT